MRNQWDATTANERHEINVQRGAVRRENRRKAAQEILEMVEHFAGRPCPEHLVERVNRALVVK